MENLKVKDLKALAKEKGIKGYYRLRKAELIEVLTPVGDLVDLGENTKNDQPIPEIDISIPTPSRITQIKNLVVEPVKSVMNPNLFKNAVYELIEALTKPIKPKETVKEITNDKSEPIFVIREIESDLSVPFDGG